MGASWVRDPHPVPGVLIREEGTQTHGGSGPVKTEVGSGMGTCPGAPQAASKRPEAGKAGPRPPTAREGARPRREDFRLRPSERGEH